MKRDAIPHLSDESLDSTIAAAYSREWTSKVFVLALLAEVDARKRYLKLGFPSMIAYCLGKFPLCDQAAFKRIQAARAGRRFPEIFEALEDRRLHLSAVVMLAPHLTKQSVAELIAAASYKSKSQIERMLADRCPRPDVEPRVEAICSFSQALTANPLSPGIVESAGNGHPNGPAKAPTIAAASPAAEPLIPPCPTLAVPASVLQQAPAPPLMASSAASQRPRVSPLGGQRFAVQFTMDQAAHDDLRRVQELLSHRLPSGDLARTFALALQSLRRDLEKRKFAATPKPRASRASACESRHIPADVKRAVWARDGGSCTFVSDTGRRCGSRKLVEFDHVAEAARGGAATISGLRLRCRAHNQYTAECTFGPEFMRRKREAAAEARAAATESRELAVEAPREAAPLHEAWLAAATRSSTMPA